MGCKGFVGFAKQNSLLLSGIFLVVLSFVILTSRADIVTTNSISFNNNTGTLGLSLNTLTPAAAAQAHIFWNGTAQPMGYPGNLSNAAAAKQLYGTNVTFMMFGQGDANQA